jgi:hypothetical protein
MLAARMTARAAEAIAVIQHMLQEQEGPASIRLLSHKSTRDPATEFRVRGGAGVILRVNRRT